MIHDLSLNIGVSSSISFKMDDALNTDTVVADAAARGLVYYEVPFPTVLGALLETSDDAFLDVGANTGLFSLLAAAVNPRIEVFAFEPLPKIVALLQHNIALNSDLATRTQVQQMALSDRQGRFAMAEHINPFGLVSTSSTLEDSTSEGVIEYSCVDVNLTTLDKWIDEHPSVRPGVIKIDVEGHEAAMFRGALKTLKSFRPMIIVELLSGSDFGFFSDLIDALDYSDIPLFPGKAELRIKPQFHSEAWNHLLCPSERLWSFATICNRIGLPIA